MSSSDLSPSPPSSPAVTSGIHQELTLELLVRHFVAAKRSLTSTSHAWRANELVTSSRSLIEEIAILNAKNIFARRNLQCHIETLQNIRRGIADAGKKATEEFKETIADLDQANGRLQETLRSLKETVLHESLVRSKVVEPSEGSGRQREDGEQSEDQDSKSPTQSTTHPKTLYDFILETDHENILASLRALIDSFQEAHGDFDEGLATFDNTLMSIFTKVSRQNTTSPPLDNTSITGPSASIRALFTSLEAHATSMATLLQSLISHYDLCVSALKHTEGGGHAAYLAAQAEHLTRSPGASTAGAEESLYRKTVPEPISHRERTEMLSVLTSDAEEVDDVVSELRDRGDDMEIAYSALLSHATQSRSTHRHLRAATATLHHLRTTSLPIHMNTLRAFTKTWKAINADMTSQTSELIALTDFHVHFLAAYAKLLTEIERRDAAEAKMRKVADKAKRELDRLWDLDGEAREAFMEDAGRYLPGDLYPAIGSGAKRWMVTQEGTMESETGGGGEGMFG